MKKLMGCAAVMCLWIGTAMAQTGAKKSKSTVKAQAKTEQRTVLTSNSANAAYDKSSASRLYIADPAIRVYNNRGFATARPDAGKAIIGIPKWRTGIAHGQVIFYSTTSATSGTSTGSGTVGTGTSLGNVGTSGAGMGVNGKNPYAGPGIYGTRVINDRRTNAAWTKPAPSGQ